MDTVSGRVLSQSGNPVVGAVVRLQASPSLTITNQTGDFLLEGLPIDRDLRVTAFATGYFIKEFDTRAGITGAEIILTPHTAEDHPEYEFLSAGIIQGGEGENTGCAECHAASSVESKSGLSLPYDEWQLDAHALSAVNPRFLSMFNGRDLAGNQSELTRYIRDRDYGSLPLPPDPDRPYYGPGYLLDFPGSTGNCATCHMPILAIDYPLTSDPNQADGVELEGINCDFCHKVWDIKLNPSTGLPYPNMTGVLSYEFRRPSADHQFFAGPFDDVAPGEDTYSALQTESAYCASCHQAEFWGVPIYNSYGEWLSSSYADPDSGNFQTCQDCHMPPLGMTQFARSEVGGLQRDPELIFSHRMPGAADQKLLENTAELEISAFQDGDVLVLDVVVSNTGAGHHMPTDSPLRQIYLVVEARDQDDQPLALLEGPQLPDWAGYLSGHPGVYFAKILRQLWTEIEPTGAYWTQTQITEDTRLAAQEESRSQYRFSITGVDQINLQSSLVFRRAFQELMDQKGWQDPDIIMKQESLTITITADQ